ncbi:hypothetical protein WKH57_01385 [Niallia taxi]|uniref:hypothetical protein n=1 Tax=Niallia taxi TaxID=2499688 RepID=UPI0031727338
MGSIVIILIIAAYVVTGLIMAHSAVNWIFKAQERNWHFDKESKKTVETAYFNLNNGIQGKLTIIFVYLAFAVTWLPMYIYDNFINKKRS